MFFFHSGSLWLGDVRKVLSGSRGRRLFLCLLFFLVLMFVFFLLGGFGDELLEHEIVTFLLRRALSLNLKKKKKVYVS